MIAVIVTYADRFKYCKEVIGECLNQGVSQVVLVDNGSDEPSRNYLDDLSKKDTRIILIRHSENLGSAGGYHSGLSYVLKNLTTDLIWILDDDNLPEKDALKQLLSARNLFLIKDSSNDVVLYSYRGDAWIDDRLAVTKGYIKCYYPNNFMGVNFLNSLFKRVNNYLFKEELNYPIIRTKIGPYGGMFLSFSALKKVGLPNKEFYLYADDHDFSLRFEKLSINQYLVYFSKLKDIDISFPVKNRFFSPGSSEFKLFYSVRNHVYLSQNFIHNKTIYNFNKLSFIIFMILKSIPFIIKSPKLYFGRVRLIFNAISDGENRRLGKKN